MIARGEGRKDLKYTPCELKIKRFSHFVLCFAFVETLAESLTNKIAKINGRAIVYHQHGVLYIIKSQRDTPSVMIYTLKRDDIRMYISPQASYTFNDMPSLRLG